MRRHRCLTRETLVSQEIWAIDEERLERRAWSHRGSPASKRGGGLVDGVGLLPFGSGPREKINK